MLPHESQVIDGERFAPREAAHADRAADGIGRDVERLQQPFESGLVLDDVEHLGQGHELDALDLVGDERIEIVAAQLAVSDDVAPDVVLQTEEIDHRGVGHPIELVPPEPAAAQALLCVAQRKRARPASDRRHREEGQGGHVRPYCLQKTALSRRLM